MIKFVDFKLAIGEKKINNDTIEDEAGWERGQVYLKTGINQRFISSKSSENLAYEAIKDIKNLNWIKNVDLVISVTNTPSTLFPNFSNFAHTFLNLKNDCKCLGLNSGCTGFVEALELIYLYFKNGYKKALIITYDTYTQFLSNSDFSTRTLFSDGASVTLLEKDINQWSIKSSKVSSVSNTQNCLIMEKKNNKINMKGPSIFTFGLKHVKKDINELILNIPKSIYLFHQAGKVMLDSLIKSLPDNSIVPINYPVYGNLVSTSIPCLMNENLKLINENNSLVMCGFGVGLSSHSILMAK